jgi:uncharacterized membrane-anchored protein YitT (DUF2179 family)
MERHRFVSICAASLLATGLAVMCHEAAHVVTGWIAGGAPTLLTATEVKGEFGSLSPAGFVLFGASGSLVNLLFALLGWWVLGRSRAESQLRLTAWFFFAVNGFLVVNKMFAEPLSGFGDWMTVLSPLPGTLYTRIIISVLGAAGMVFLVRRSGATLARIVAPGDPTQRVAEARRIVLVGAAAAILLAVGGSVANPVGTTRGMLLALGATLGPFIPMAFGARFAGRIASEVAGPVAPAGWPWLGAAGMTTAVLWFVVGPGIALAGVLGRR